MTPPVSAFAVALHTVPSPQDDGSYLWIYTWVNGDEEAQIRLRGRQVDASRVEWEMRVSSTYYGFENELWFEGETWSDANEGVWRFHDAERDGAHVARLEWGADAEGNFLRLVDTLDHPDDSLEYPRRGPAQERDLDRRRHAGRVLVRPLERAERNGLAAGPGLQRRPAGLLG